MKSYDLLCVGDVNVDIILDKMSSAPALGQEVLCEKMYTTMGGAASILACNAGVLGTRVGFVGKVGQDSYGDFLLECLSQKGVCVKHITRISDQPTGATVVLRYVKNDRAMVTCTGAMSGLASTDVTDDILATSRHLHVSGVFLMPQLQKDIVTLFARAKAAGLTTSIDPQWDPARQWSVNLPDLLPLVDIFLPNEGELIAMTGESDVEAALQSVSGVVNAVVVKQGVKGSLLYTEGNYFQQPANLNKNAVDAVGAGDSFNAGFLTAFLKGQPLQVCQRFANAMGAVSTRGAGGISAFSSREEVLRNAEQYMGCQLDWL